MTPNTPQNTLVHALGYLSRGWSVIPVPHGTKTPKIKWEPYQIIRADEEQVRAWFEEKKSNIAIVTGKISGIVIVDIDLGADISGLDLPATPTILSGGGGKHLYYRYPEGIDRIQNSAGIIRPHIDIRADGGMIIAPPSIHPSGNPYVFDTGSPRTMAVLPEWIWKQDESKKPKTQRISKAEKNNWSDFMETKNNEGTRNANTTKYVGKILSDLSEELWHTAGWASICEYNISHNTPPLDETELREIFDSISKAESKRTKEGSDKKDDKKTVADKLLELVLPEITLFKNQTNDGFARIQCEKHFENHAIASNNFRLWLTRRYYEDYAKSVSPEAVSSVANTLSAQAEYR